MNTAKHISLGEKKRDGTLPPLRLNSAALISGCKRNCLSLSLFVLVAGCQPAPLPGPAGSNYSVLAHSDGFTRTLKDGGTIALYDATTNTLLVRLQVSPKSKLEVDAKDGVTLGKNKVLPGPLPKDHVYELRLEN